MKLQDYQQMFGVGDTAMARQLGCTRVYVWQMRTMKKIPSPKMMAMIKKKTKGLVMPNDFFDGAQS